MVLGVAADPGRQGTHRHAGAVHIRYIQYLTHFNYLFLIFFFASGVGFPLFPEIFSFFYTVILQRIRIIVGDARFEPGTSASDV